MNGSGPLIALPFGLMSTDAVGRNAVGPMARAMEFIVALGIIGAGVAVGVGLALIPGTVFSSQTNGGCGTPIVDAFTTTHNSLEASCRHEGYGYVVVGLILGALLAWGGLLVLLQAIASPDRPAPRPSRRRLATSALIACALVGIAIAVAGTVTYETGSQAPIYVGDV